MASEFFATNAHDPPHWTLKWRFGAFRTIWVHLGPFGCLTKLEAKQTELVQKFVPRSRVGIFCNERTWSTPFNSKLKILLRFILFGCWDRLVTLQNSVQNVLNWCKSSWHEVASEFFATNALDPPYRTLNWCFGTFRFIWAHFGPFGCTKSCRNFSQRTHPIHPIGP